jgi:hypothetical protein
MREILKFIFLPCGAQVECPLLGAKGGRRRLKKRAGAGIDAAQAFSASITCTGIW